MIKILVKSIFEFINFIPNFLFSSIRIFRIGAYKDRLVNLNPGDRKIVILGNGPSLKNDIESISKDGSDFFCVNHFADSDFFVEFRPKMYLFLDPYFWSIGVNSEYENKRSITFDNINRKVSWPIKIFIPSYADEAIFNLFYNSNVEVVRYSAIGIKEYPRFLENFLLNTSFFSPYAINVVIHAIFISIHSGYKSIDLYGVDTSVFLSLRVDSDTNQVYAEFEHFYGKSRVIQNEAGLRGKSLTLAECLNKEYYNFLTYELISRYSKHRGVVLRNCASFSLIDSIERKNSI